MTLHERAAQLVTQYFASDPLPRPLLISAIESALREQIEACAVAAEQVVPRHTECGNKIAAAIRRLAKE